MKHSTDIINGIINDKLCSSSPRNFKGDITAHFALAKDVNEETAMAISMMHSMMHILDRR